MFFGNLDIFYDFLHLFHRLSFSFSFFLFFSKENKKVEERRKEKCRWEENRMLRGTAFLSCNYLSKTLVVITLWKKIAVLTNIRSSSTWDSRACAPPIFSFCRSGAQASPKCHTTSRQDWFYPLASRLYWNSWGKVCGCYNVLVAKGKNQVWRWPCGPRSSWRHPFLQAIGKRKRKQKIVCRLE